MGTVWVGSIIYLNDKYPDVEWDWKNINTKDMYFPKNFIWGTATAAHQVEGFNTNNNWYRWEHSFCLLYTSPSPRDKRQSRMPSSA